MTESESKQMEHWIAQFRKGAVSRREFLARTTMLLAAGTAIGSMPSIGRADDVQPKAGGFARFGLSDASQNDTLDPGTWVTSFTGAAFNGSLCNNLTEILPDGSITGDLAESFEPEDGAKRWVFKLRDGVTFHDGKSLKAEDVKQSFLHHMAEDSSSGARAIVAQVESIEADGDKAIFTLKTGNADFPYLVTDYHLSIFPANADGTGIDFARGAGTGAFTLESFEPGIGVRMKRNPNYHKNNKPYFDEVEFVSVTEPTARLNALLTGEVHVINDVDVRNVPLIERNPDFAITRTPSLRHFTFDMNTSVAPFDNPDVRLALKYAIDRDDIIDKVFLGEALKGNDNPVSNVMEYYADTPPQYEYNIEKAKEHLAKAGLDSLTIDLSAAEAAFPGAVEAAVLFKEHAAPAGITINVVREADDGYWENVWLKKPFNGCDWFGRATLDWLFATSYTSDSPWNNTGWKNAHFDELHALARVETDHSKRAVIYKEMQQMLHDDGGVMTVAFVNYLYGMSGRIGHGEIGGILPADIMRMSERWWFKD